MHIDRRMLLKVTAAAGGSVLLPFGAARGASAGRFDWTLATPEAGGMSRTGLAGMRAAIRANIDAKIIAGAVTAVAHRNRLVSYEAQGLADVASGQPMTTRSLFRMMSSTKVVTAVAVMMMVEEGRLSLNDPVSRFIPGFRHQRVALAAPGTTDPAKVTFVPATRDITVLDLLTHTSGLSSYSEGITPGIATLVNTARRGPGATLASVVPQFGAYALDFQPGTKWRYSALDGFDTLLYLVEIVSRVPADRFVRERILQPLDMRRTWFDVPRSEKDNVVRLYAARNGSFERRPWLLEEAPASYISGAAGLVSCAHDMLNLELMLLGGGSFDGRRLLTPASVAAMSRNHVGTLFADWIPSITGGSGFGLGVRVVEDGKRSGGRGVGSFGWGGAYGTETWADPKNGTAAVMLIQMDPAPANVKIDFGRALGKAIVA